MSFNTCIGTRQIINETKMIDYIGNKNSKKILKQRAS